MASSSPAASLTGLFHPPPDSDLIETERTGLLKPKDSSLNGIFQPPREAEVLVPIKREDDEDARHQSPPETPTSTLLTSCQKLVTPDCLKSTCIGSSLFLLFHVVFCLAQASAIARPHATTPVIGPGTVRSNTCRLTL